MGGEKIILGSQVGEPVFLTKNGRGRYVLFAIKTGEEWNELTDPEVLP